MSGRAHETFWLDLRVYYEDTDAAGVVYYANYLRFMERARTEWLQALGFELTTFSREHGIAFAVHRLDVEYAKPARLGERIRAGVTLLDAGRSRLMLEQPIVRHDETLTRARVSLACLDVARWKPTRVPAVLLSRLDSTVHISEA